MRKNVNFKSLFALMITLLSVSLTGQRAYAQTDGVNNLVFNVGDIEFTMVALPGGTFTMGSFDDESGTQVTLSPYMIGQTEVTQELWEAVMGYNKCQFRGPKLPVGEVSWFDCQEFITKLNEITGFRFRLPTAAEWEFAARGGNSSHYLYSGSDNINEVAWYISNSGHAPHEVATKKPNQFGIYDMTGNMAEWCQDWMGELPKTPQTDPTGPASGEKRVTRGGGWESQDSFSSVLNGGGMISKGINYSVGFRLVHPIPLYQ